jgi:hypothetical protein
MSKDEALKLALEALVYASSYCDTYDAITAVREALAEQPAPLQEPVAWTVSGKITDWSKDFSAYQTKHYTRPVYTPPAAQRPWTGLTDEEIDKIPCELYAPDQGGMTMEEGLQVYARAIEAKLKELNT